MTYLKSLPDDAKVYHVFASRPALYEPFTEACEQIMRGPSPLSRGDRELIGAFVSALNNCPYCHDVHNEAVTAYGIDAALAQRLTEDIETAAVADPLTPAFALARLNAAAPNEPATPGETVGIGGESSASVPWICASNREQVRASPLG